MKNRKKLRKMRGIMLALGFVMDAVEVATIMIWIFKGIWLPFAIGMAFCVALGVGISVVYFKKTAFICLACHTVFRSGFRETFFAYHTPRTRRLTCPQCGRHGLCVETFNENDTGENHAENQQPHKALSGL